MCESLGYVQYEGVKTKWEGFVSVYLPEITYLYFVLYYISRLLNTYYNFI